MVDRWEVRAGDPASGRISCLQFTQTITPMANNRTGPVWRISRNFAIDDAAVDDLLQNAFADYYPRVKDVVETVQRTNGPVFSAGHDLGDVVDHGHAASTACT